MGLGYSRLGSIVLGVLYYLFAVPVVASVRVLVVEGEAHKVVSVGVGRVDTVVLDLEER